MIGSRHLHLLTIVNGAPKQPRAVPTSRPKANLKAPSWALPRASFGPYVPNDYLNLPRFRDISQCDCAIVVDVTVMHTQYRPGNLFHVR